ncbi:BARD1 [Symbiodinium necroappetens]|uniref:BARD1 protein n=1 Tax=Symbiodinium necroappetens TaxID=1628268 RepID=A0A812ST19_9DINO|nr:BARD1 [Symbiodinium necroappetens]
MGCAAASKVHPQEHAALVGKRCRGAQTVRFDDVSISAFTPFNDSQGNAPEGKQTTFVEDQEDDSELEARAWSSMKSPLPKEPGVPYPPDRSIHEWHLQRMAPLAIFGSYVSKSFYDIVLRRP